MAKIEGGWRGTACEVLIGSWGLVLTYGAAARAVTAEVSVGIAAVWTGLSIGLCGVVGSVG